MIKAPGKNPFGALPGVEPSPELKPLEEQPPMTVGRFGAQSGLWLPTNTPLVIDGEKVTVAPPADKPGASHALWPCAPGRHIVNNRQWLVRHHDVTVVAIW